MSISEERDADEPVREERRPDYAQYLVVAVLVIVG